MPEYPPARYPDILVHGRGHRTDHPAVPVAASDLCTDRCRFRRIPQFLPALAIQIAHHFLILCTVAGHDIPLRINEKGVKAHIAGQQAFLSVNIIDQSVVKVSPEPLFGAVGI